MIHEPLRRTIIVAGLIRRQAFQHHFPCIHGEIPAAEMNKPGQVKGIGDHVEKALLFPHRVGDIGAHQTDPSQPKVDGRYRHILGSELTLIALQRIGKGIRTLLLQTPADLRAIQCLGILLAVLWQQDGLHKRHSFRMAAPGRGYAAGRLIAGQNHIGVPIQVQIHHIVVAGNRHLVQNAFGYRLFGDVRHRQNTGDISRIGRFHKVHLELNITPPILIRQLDKAFLNLLGVLIGKGGQCRPVQIGI